MAVKAKIAHITTRTGLPRMSYEEFLDWSDEDTLAEWVDGKVEMMSPASAEHQDLSGFLVAMLRWYAEESRRQSLSCAVPDAPGECEARARTGCDFSSS